MLCEDDRTSFYPLDCLCLTCGRRPVTHVIVLGRLNRILVNTLYLLRLYQRCNMGTLMPVLLLLGVRSCPALKLCTPTHHISVDILLGLRRCVRLGVDEILLLIEVLLLVLEVLVSEIALLLAKDHRILLVTRHALLDNITDCHRLLRDVRVLQILERLVQALYLFRLG